MNCTHEWTPYQREGLTFNARCANCGELALEGLENLTDELCPQNENEEQGRHIPINEEQAERHLDWLRYRNGLIDEISQRMDAEIARLETRKAQLLSGHLQRVEYLEASLKKHLQESGKKRIDYAYGTIKFTKGREHVEIDNDSAFCFRHGDTPALVSITRRPDKAGIKAQIKATGEIPDGCDLVRKDDSFTITLTPSKE